jgi:hypothetical protein
MALLMPGTPLHRAADVTSGQNDGPRIPSLWPAPLAPLSQSHVGEPFIGVRKDSREAFSGKLELRDPPLPRAWTALRRPETRWRPRNRPLRALVVPRPDRERAKANRCMGRAPESISDAARSRLCKARRAPVHRRSAPAPQVESRTWTNRPGCQAPACTLLRRHSRPSRIESRPSRRCEPRRA